MRLTLLLDLDDTLLGNNFDEFLPYYLDAFSKIVAPIVEQEKFVRALMRSTGAMISNRKPDCTLQEVFESSFYPDLEVDEVAFKDLAEKFYSEVFPTLKSHTAPQKEAVQLVNASINQGHRLAVATNPLFPRTAIAQRLSWANLSPKDYKFHLISSFELFHFTKPEPAYFAEVMAGLGWPDGPALMVGDDLYSDIIPAQKLGLPVFWVNHTNGNLPGDHKTPTASGNIGDVLPWLNSVNWEELIPDYSSMSACQAVLRSTPAALDTFNRGLAPGVWRVHPQPSEWSIGEIFCHLRDVETEVNVPRIKKILLEDNPFLPGEDTDTWADERCYVSQNGTDALYHFIAERQKLLDLIEDITYEDWRRPARHAIFGRTDMAEVVNFMAGHDRLHLKQLHEVLSAVTR